MGSILLIKPAIVGAIPAPAIEDLVTVEPAGELTLKGISRPMVVHNVVGHSEKQT